VNSPILALYRVPPPVLPVLLEATSRVWSGAVHAVDEIVALPTLIAVAATQPADAFALARQAESVRGRVPVLAMVSDGARQVRASRLPGNVAWVVAPDELDPRVLGLAMRYALEVAARWRLSDQLQALRPLADLGQVASATSHEIGNPLTSLLMNLEGARTLAAALPPSEEARQLGAVVADALDGARHVSRIAQDLSRASRPVGKRATVDAWALVDTARRLSAETLRGVDVELPRKFAVPVRVDERRLTQVLMNLFRNAAQAMSASSSSGGVAHRRIRVEIGVEGPEAVLRVSDTGPGIAPQVAHRLFEPWVTTKSQGSGLGLSLARQYLSEMEGTIAWEASERGATFVLRLPLGEPEARRPTLVPDVTTRDVRVLVIDDVAIVRRSIARSLAALAKVDQAADAEEALALLEEAPTRGYDVVLLDMNLAGANGIQVYEQLRRAAPDRLGDVVFLSGGFTAREQEWLDLHDLRWARKPLGAEDVRDLVIGLLSART
jgi:signal transduction histidine kinase